MDNQHKVCGDEDAMLMDVPISFITPQKSKVVDLEYKVGDEDATLMEVPISLLESQESKADVVENMDKQRKDGDDKDAILLEVPIYFITHDESKANVLEKMDKHHKVDHRDAIMAIPISSIAPQAGVSLKMDKHHKVDRIDAIMAVPISSIAPQTGVSLNMDKQYRVDGDEDATLMDVSISFIALEKVNDDVLQVYLHLETTKKFRSLIEVYKFVVYGEVLEITKKSRENEETSQVTPRRKPHVRGKKLIRNYVVGTCTKSYNGVYIKNRGEANYLFERDIPSNIEKKRKRGNEDLYGHEQVNLGDDATRVNSGDATLSTPIQSFLYLWDFEVMPEAHNENLS